MAGPSMGLLQTVRQEQVLSPQMLQKMALLALPVAEMKERIQKEVEENPALEIPGSSPLLEPLPAPAGEAASDGGDGPEEGLGPDSWDEEASDRKRAFIENSPAAEQTLSDHLAEQLAACDVSEELQETALVIITSLDSNGFYTRPLEDLVEDPARRALLPEAVALIRSFEPPGVCVPGYRESLVLQAERAGLHADDLRVFSDLVANHLEDMRPSRLPLLASRLGIPLEDLGTYLDILRSLTPYPGGQFAGGDNSYAIPELSIRRKDDDLVLELNRSNLPDLRLSPGFASLADGLKGEEAEAASAYIGQSLRRARLLISQVELRYRTLYNTALALMELQRDFFLYGPGHLRPLTLKDVASKVGVHETTISRISQSKWIDTDWGPLRMKALFSAGLKTEGGDGQEVSRTVVKRRIEDIVEENDGAVPLSDQKIADILAKEGIKIARRTVAKYRAELNMDSSYDR